MFNFIRKFGSWILSFSTVALCVGCGPLSLGNGGGTSTLSDPRPQGFPIKQAQFFAQNGQTNVTGSAAIFFNGETNQYTLRIEGLNIVEESGLQIRIFAAPTTQAIRTFNLRGFTGDQNYSFSIGTSNVNFTTISIFSTTNNINYAQAQFSTNTTPGGN